ncbi:MAG: 2,3-bisphosphoglycerate-independent phosphoglycerate mutase [bacterium]
MSFNGKASPFVLAILDGWGLAPSSKGNAITLAKTPNMDNFYKKYPWTKLCASGECVGLSKKQVGNSEAGHMNIGAGRVVPQDAVYIAQSINDGTFFKNSAFKSAIDQVRRFKSKLHLMGLLSGEQSAHVDFDHLIALLTLMKFHKVEVYLHLFTDGRDSPQQAANSYLKRLKYYLRNHERIATIMGRFYAMDRKKAWANTQKAYNALVLGEGLKFKSAEDAILAGYKHGQTDEFISPSVIIEKKKNKIKPIASISHNDAVIFYNLRSDRARQLTKAFVQKKFIGFKRKKILKNLCFVAMTDFGPDLPGILTAFPGHDLEATLPIKLKDLRQLYIAETEKYAHMTYFFNGGYDHPVAKEERILMPSPKIDHYDQQPEMSAKEITKKVINYLRKDSFDFIAINFANPDMVGHTGNLKAVIRACEVVDNCVGQIARVLLKRNGTLIVTADHGNAEEMINLKTGEADTQHTSNLAPFILINKPFSKNKIKLKDKGILADISPTILNLMDHKITQEMTGASLII